jgi:hypothetical protein
VDSAEHEIEAVCSEPLVDGSLVSLHMAKLHAAVDVDLAANLMRSDLRRYGL